MKQEKTVIPSEKLQLSKLILSPTINLLGKILGEVIIEQAGEEHFHLEEKIRQVSKAFREGDLDTLLELERITATLTPKQRIVVIKSFSIFFQLVNLAEEDYKIHLNDLYRKEEGRLDTLKNTIVYAKSMGLTKLQLFKILEKLQFKLVWTAHPTEARRLTNLIKLREIFTLIEKLHDLDEVSHIYRNIVQRIKVNITLLWQTDDLREEKVKILDEVRTNLFYFDNTIFSILPELIHELKYHIKEIYGEAEFTSLPVFLEFGSWVGGDRDGHPGVTANVTIQTLLLHKRLCLRKYSEEITTLIQELSSSTNQIQVSDQLKYSIEKDANVFKDFADRTKNLNRYEIYRKKLDFILLKLKNTLELVEQTAEQVGLGRTLVGSQIVDEGVEIHKSMYYSRSSEFMDDLMIIDHSLRENKASVIADETLTLLITKVKIFGFHLAPLDLRQHSKVHHQAIGDILNCIGISNFNEKTYSEKKKIILNELKNPRPLGVLSYYQQLSDQTQELFSTLQVAKDSLTRISPRAIQSYIISMTQNDLDLYIVLLLMKETNLVNIVNNEVISSDLDIVPLFETKEDLENAPEVMDGLFSTPLYQSLIQSKGNIQEIMIGYSDSTKDVGYLQSNYQLITVQKELVRVTKKYGIKLRMFHGRGGSISRGGGPTHRAILSQPPGTLFRMKITQQGEVIGWNYANPMIAHRHLEQILSAMIQRSILDTTYDENDNPAALKEEYINEFRKIADIARVQYEDLVKKNSKFIPFYLQYTPLDAIERATIGSRPSRRKSDKVLDIDSLRAIPWIFSWMQTRLIFTTYYGVGKSLHLYIEENGIDKLVEMYQSWPYFASLLDNLQMLLLKVDIAIAEKYLSLVDEGTEIFEMIVEEYKMTVDCIKKIAGIEILMGNYPDIRNSIIRRNAYIDPLSLIQIELLKQWREEGRPGNYLSSGLQKALLQTINGIAAGLRNTG